VTFLGGGKTYSDPSFIFSGGQHPFNPQDLRPCTGTQTGLSALTKPFPCRGFPVTVYEHRSTEWTWEEPSRHERHKTHRHFVVYDHHDVRRSLRAALAEFLAATTWRHVITLAPSGWAGPEAAAAARLLWQVPARTTQKTTQIPRASVVSRTAATVTATVAMTKHFWDDFNHGDRTHRGLRLKLEIRGNPLIAAMAATKLKSCYYTALPTQRRCHCPPISFEPTCLERKVVETSCLGDYSPLRLFSG